jgi:hypothetical protein
MKFKFDEAVEEEIDSLVTDLLDFEEIQEKDIGFIIFLRKASCGKMTEGGWKEVACTVEVFENYRKNYDIKIFEGENIVDLPIYIENEALDLLKEKKIIELEVKGSIIKEIKVKDAPMVDLGDCRVKIPMD